MEEAHGDKSIIKLQIRKPITSLVVPSYIFVVSNVIWHSLDQIESDVATTAARK
jgi:hypothetical protein